MDIAAWLQGLGLERYVPAFRDNDVDAEVLPELTAEDLISIGVTSVGHRRKLLAAIAAVGAANVAQPPTLPIAPPAGGSPLPFPPLPSPATRGSRGRQGWGQKPNAGS
jgi:SAM domain (Sterile alpha motif)